MYRPILWLGLFYPVTATTVVCCILMQILYVVSQRSFSFWGTLSPRLHTGALPLYPAGGLPPPRPLVFFYVPPVRSMPLVVNQIQSNVRDKMRAGSINNDANLKHIWMTERLARTHVSFENITELFHNVWVLEHIHILHTHAHTCTQIYQTQ